MARSLSREIRINIHLLLRHEVSLREFRHWFHDLVTRSEGSVDAVSRRLIYDIELALAELDSGAWSDDEFRQELTSLAGTNVVV